MSTCRLRVWRQPESNFKSDSPVSARRAKLSIRQTFEFVFLTVELLGRSTDVAGGFLSPAIYDLVFGSRFCCCRRAAEWSVIALSGVWLLHHLNVKTLLGHQTCVTSPRLCGCVVCFQDIAATLATFRFPGSPSSSRLSLRARRTLNSVEATREEASCDDCGNLYYHRQ